MTAAAEALKLGGFKSFLGDFRKLGGATGRTAAEDVSLLLRNVDSGVKSADEVVKKLKVTRNAHGALLLNDVHVGRINRLLREGDLRGLVDVSRLNVPVTAADASAFRRLVGNTPESGLRNVDDVAKAAKRDRPHLDATPDDLDKLSPAAKQDLKKVESNLYRYFKEGTVIALTVGVVTVGADWILRATEARRGCFMVTTIDGRTTSCKVASYTCGGGGDVGKNCPLDGSRYNTTLVLMHLANAPDGDPDKIALARATGVDANRLGDELADIIDNRYPAVAAAVAKMDSRVFGSVRVCDLKSDAVEGGVVPPCRMCDPTADPVGTAFIDPTQYGDNVTFQCVTNPSVLDTIADTAVSTGADLWTGVTGAFMWSLKRIGTVAAAILAVLVLLSVVTRALIRRRTVQDDDDEDDVVGRHSSFTPSMDRR